MNLPTVASIGTALPAYRYTQQELFELYSQLLPAARKRLVRAVFENSRIKQRYFILRDMLQFWSRRRSTAERNQRYIREAMGLGRQAVEEALARAGLEPTDIDDFIVVSCTGLDTPGLDLRIAGALGMKPALRRTVIGSMGCYGAFPGLNHALNAVVARPGSRALVLCVEIGSIHMQPDASRETIISSALFADGAAAIVVSSHPDDRESEGARPRLIDNETRCNYETFDEMTFTVTDEGFRMYMSSYVPHLLAANVAPLLQPLLERNGLSPNGISYWGIHPGGARILDHLQESLDLDNRAMGPSYAILREYGNMSSATILFVLDRIQRHHIPHTGEYGIIMAFGPGLTMEAALLRW